MLKLQNVDKYFYRRKSNQIHVIDDTTLEFGESGLTALLGPSGCGKTTLLNVIGGLDKPDRGQIYVNGQKLTGRTAGTVDKIRNLNIGYIFQNYNLIDSMTVFDNVAMVLRMVGIKDKEEIRQKVDYALDLVGMYRYRKRYADMLSGGETSLPNWQLLFPILGVSMMGWGFGRLIHFLHHKMKSQAK